MFRSFLSLVLHHLDNFDFLSHIGFWVIQNFQPHLKILKRWTRKRKIAKFEYLDHSVLPPGRWGRIFFCLSGLYCWEPWWVRRLYGMEYYFLALEAVVILGSTVYAGAVVILSLTVYAYLKQNLLVVSIIYSCHITQSHDKPTKL